MKLVFPLSFLFLATLVEGQTNGNIVYSANTPSGACQNRANLVLKVPNGTLYSCQSNVWTAIGGGGVGSVSSFNTRTGAVTLNNTDVISATGDKGTYIFGAGYNSAVCDNATDDTTAFNTLLTTVNTAGGGRILIAGGCLMSGNIVFPNDAQATPSQNTIEIFGYGSTGSGDSGTISAARSYLNLTNNASVAKLDTRGKGQLIIHDLNLIDSGSDCASFIQTTNTRLNIYNVTISGTGTGLAACNDGIVYGGTSSVVGSGSTSPFRGYGTTSNNLYFDKIRRAFYFRTDANGITVANWAVSATSGSNLTTTISSCTAANPAVCTSTAHLLTTAGVYKMRIVGGTGNWTPLNGAQTITVVDANTFSVTGVNSTTFGALTGTVGFYSGATVEFDGSGNGALLGGQVSGCVCEVQNYGVFAKFASAQGVVMTGNGLYDPNGTTVANYWIGSNAISNVVYAGHHDQANIVPSVNSMVGVTIIDPNATSSLGSYVYQPLGFNTQPFNTNNIQTKIGIGMGTSVTQYPLQVVLPTSTATFQAPSGNANGAELLFLSNTDVAQKSGFWQLDSTGNMVFRAPNNAIFLDFTNALNVRGSGFTNRFNVTDTFTTSNVPITAGGTKFTITGCGAGTTVGGSFAGSYLSGTTGACTVVITPGGTATNGWACHADDLTTPANLMSQSASTTTTCTITGTTVTGDKLTWMGIAF